MIRISAYRMFSLQTKMTKTLLSRIHLTLLLTLMVVQKAEQSL